MVEMRDGGAERAFFSERADMEFVEHGFMPRPPRPVAVRPCIRGGVGYLAGAVHVLRLEARCRVGHALPVGQDEAIARAGTSSGDVQSVPAIFAAAHRDTAPIVLECEVNARMSRCPEAEPYAAPGQ